MKQARWRWLAVVGVLAMVAAACGDSTSDETTTTAAPGTTAATTTTEAAEPFGVSVYIAEPPFIDPNLVQDSEGFEVARVLFDGLTLYDPAGSGVIPGVAESWDFNDDKTVWTFHLREDSFFSGGMMGLLGMEPRQVTAHDFVYGWARAADPDMASRVAYHGSYAAGIVGWGDVEGGEPSGAVADEAITGVVALDDFTLEVTLEKTNNILPKILAHPVFSPMPQDIIEADPEGWAEMPIGNGPYYMTGPWEHDVGIFMARNDDYYGDAGIPDTVEWRILSTQDAAFQQVQDNSLDLMTGVPDEQVEGARTEFGDRYFEQATGSFTYIGLPAHIFTDVNIRRALVMATDVDAIAERVLVGRQAAKGFVPPVAQGAVLDACPWCRYDPDTAKTMFEEAGGLAAIGGSLTVYFNAGAGHEEWVEAVANDWSRNLGVDVTFEAYEWAAYLDFLFGDEGAGGPFRLGWGWDYPSAYNFIAPLYGSGSDDNLTGFSNADLDAALASAISADTEEEGLPFLATAQEIIGDQIPVVPIVFGLARGVYSTCVDNVIYTDFGFTLVEVMQPTGAC